MGRGILQSHTSRGQSSEKRTIWMDGPLDPVLVLLLPDTSQIKLLRYVAKPLSDPFTFSARAMQYFSTGLLSDAIANLALFRPYGCKIDTQMCTATISRSAVMYYCFHRSFR